LNFSSGNGRARGDLFNDWFGVHSPLVKNL
jgi:hypothetical protein